jgi:hypothetical protein
LRGKYRRLASDPERIPGRADLTFKPDPWMLCNEESSPKGSYRFTEQRQISKVLARTALFMLGLSFFGLGFLYYLKARTSHLPIAFVILNIEPQRHIVDSIKDSTIMLSLPTFLHTLSFTLMLIAIVCRSEKQVIFTSVGWLLVEVVFELLQLADYPSLFAFIMRSSQRFISISSSRFDPLDLIAALIASLIAVLLSLYIGRRFAIWSRK